MFMHYSCMHDTRHPCLIPPGHSVTSQVKPSMCDGNPLPFVQGVCKIMGFPLLSDASEFPKQHENFQIVYALSEDESDLTLHVCYDSKRRELLLQARIGHVTFPACNDLIQWAIKAQSVLMESGLFLFVDPIDDHLCLQHKHLSIDGLETTRFAEHMSQLSRTAMAWREQLERPATQQSSQPARHSLKPSWAPAPYM